MTKEIVRPGSAGRLPAIAAVTVLVVLGAVLVDRAIHDPPCQDGAAAVAVVEREALPALEELPAGEDYALEAGEPEPYSLLNGGKGGKIPEESRFSLFTPGKNCAIMF